MVDGYQAEGFSRISKFDTLLALIYIPVFAFIIYGVITLIFYGAGGPMIAFCHIQDKQMGCVNKYEEVDIQNADSSYIDDYGVIHYQRFVKRCQCVDGVKK